MSNNEPYMYRDVKEMQEQGLQFSLGNFQRQEPPSYPQQTEPGYAPSTNNVYYADQYATPPGMNPLMHMYNVREHLMPNMVGVNNENLIVYGRQGLDGQQQTAPGNLNLGEQTNGNLSGLSYPTDFSNYNLFSNAGASPFASDDSMNSSVPSTPHLIQNLVGQWGTGTGGTYSPFGSSVSPPSDMSNDRSVRKPRMVAEVRPMRLSYSDVLAKSVPNQKPGKQEGKTKPTDVKNGRNNRSSVGRTLSGNAGLVNRHNSTEEEQPSKQHKFLNTLKKLMTPQAGNARMNKNWVSLDDLTGSVNETEFIREDTNRKSTAKVLPTKKVKEGWEPSPSGATKTGKSPELPKKGNGTGNTPKIFAISRDAQPAVKPDPVKSKPADERKASTQLKSENKSARRNSRNQADKEKKARSAGKGGRRRDTAGGWRALVAHRFDMGVACALRAVTWLVTLVLDVFALSTHLFFYMCSVVWQSCRTNVSEKYVDIIDWIRTLSMINWISRFWPFRRAAQPSPPSDDEDDEESDDPSDGTKKRKRLPGGLKHNLPLPSTGDEAMKRLLACKGKDPYSILGVSQDCTDDDIKKYYKRQAFLVHPDKNNQPGAEEAFKILVHAFDIIGEPEHRKSYDRNVEKTAQAEQAWSELSELLAQLHKKMEYVANTLRCTNCGKRHKRSLISRPIYAARMCIQCNIHHSAREGDIWAETSVFGLMWRYFACMDGSVYDISEWAACQGDNLKNLKANTHQVQYRIVLGKNAHKGRAQQSTSAGGEPDLEEFINNLYTKPESGGGADSGSEPRTRKNRRKK